MTSCCAGSSSVRPALVFSLLNLNLLADDTNLLFADYMSHKDIDALEDIISNEFRHVSDWLIGNGLTLKDK